MINDSEYKVFVTHTYTLEIHSRNKNKNKNKNKNNNNNNIINDQYRTGECLIPSAKKKTPLNHRLFGRGIPATLMAHHVGGGS